MLERLLSNKLTKPELQKLHLQDGKVRIKITTSTKTDITKQLEKLGFKSIKHEAGIYTGDISINKLLELTKINAIKSIDPAN
jgi:hypothetical protein